MNNIAVRHPKEYIQCCKNNEYSFGCLTGSIILQGMAEKWGDGVV